VTTTSPCPETLRTLLQDLAQWNRQYEAKFGHVFLIYAAGKSADKVLAALQRR
jgi:2-oxo-4-hydroxy-4-carboxy--5-ureidoimidazoline (OHCU) decarboxylase